MAAKAAELDKQHDARLAEDRQTLERQTREEAARIADALQNADVYQWALRRGVGSMQEAAERLGTQLTDPKTVAVETDAWSRLRELAQETRRPYARQELLRLSGIYERRAEHLERRPG